VYIRADSAETLSRPCGQRLCLHVRRAYQNPGDKISKAAWIHASKFARLGAKRNVLLFHGHSSCPSACAPVVMDNAVGLASLHLNSGHHMGLPMPQSRSPSPARPNGADTPAYSGGPHPATQGLSHTRQRSHESMPGWEDGDDINDATHSQEGLEVSPEDRAGSPARSSQFAVPGLIHEEPRAKDSEMTMKRHKWRSHTHTPDGGASTAEPCDRDAQGEQRASREPEPRCQWVRHCVNFVKVYIWGCSGDLECV
jgi:hypothetical protein